MKVSSYYLPILRDKPLNAEVISHQLMLRAGMIKQQSSGIYSWLPLGLKVLRNVERIIREEMDRAGALEITMPCVQSADLWRESGRYDSYGKEMLRMKDRHDNDLFFTPTAEEVAVDIMRHHVNSYKDFPKTFYQIQWKFRDEIRPRFGVMRGREFYMKDAYSFDLNEESAIKTYDSMINVYFNIFSRMGLKSIPVRADTGPIGGDLSHEFHVVAETGESDIFYDNAIDIELGKDNPDVKKIRSLYAMADEMHVESNCNVKAENLVARKSIEVGHVFYYGTKYSAAMNTTFMSSEGKASYLHGGCYGVGVSRLVAAIIESSHDEKGIIWPESVSPFLVSIINLHIKNEESTNISDTLYKEFSKRDIDVLYHDTDVSAGTKFAKNDLLGIPFQIISSSKLALENKVEIKNRKTGEVEIIDYTSAVDRIITRSK